jgi:hypothetical protein
VLGISSLSGILPRTSISRPEYRSDWGQGCPTHGSPSSCI